MHGIVLAHAYGINVLPVTLVVATDLTYISSAEEAFGEEFEYSDYYFGLGYNSFAMRIPLVDTAFNTTLLTKQEIQLRLKKHGKSFGNRHVKRLRRSKTHRRPSSLTISSCTKKTMT